VGKLEEYIPKGESFNNEKGALDGSGGTPEETAPKLEEKRELYVFFLRKKKKMPKGGSGVGTGKMKRGICCSE